jgi:DNA (cytosine-5)-methyltransferase 1
MNELALFAGAGGGILGGHLLGWRTVCAVEWEPYAASVLIARQNEGVLPPFPIWDDVRTFDGRAWRGRVDVVSGGFPCQDISAAGKGAGIDGERSGMWAHMARIIREVGPRYCFVENSPMLTSRGLGRVLGDLAAMGYDARWGVLGGGETGAWHKRERIWIVASNNREKRISGNIEKTLSRKFAFPWRKDVRRIEDLRNRPDIPEPFIRGRRNGVAAYVDRISAIGNGQIPCVAALAWRLLN